MSIMFVDEFGMKEAGIDDGGLFKEFLSDLAKITFNPDYGLFLLTENDRELYPNPNSSQLLGPKNTDYYELYTSRF
jgi:hypothetical protein